MNSSQFPAGNLSSICGGRTPRRHRSLSCVASDVMRAKCLLGSLEQVNGGSSRRIRIMVKCPVLASQIMKWDFPSAHGEVFSKPPESTHIGTSTSDDYVRIATCLLVMVTSVSFVQGLPATLKFLQCSLIIYQVLVTFGVSLSVASACNTTPDPLLTYI